jgi:hypothetical protein
MDLYKRLSIDNYQIIADKVYDYVVKHTDILVTKYDWNNLKVKELSHHVPELVEACAKLVDCPIVMASIIYRSAGEGGKIHIDQGIAKYRLLMPIRNCQGSYTKFYDINGNQVREVANPNGNSFLTIEKVNPFIEIDSLELTEPVIFNSKVAHGVYTNPELTEPRLSITIGFGAYPIENYLI